MNFRVNSIKPVVASPMRIINSLVSLTAVFIV